MLRISELCGFGTLFIYRIKSHTEPAEHFLLSLLESALATCPGGSHYVERTAKRNSGSAKTSSTECLERFNLELLVLGVLRNGATYPISGGAEPRHNDLLLRHLRAQSASRGYSICVVSHVPLEELERGFRSAKLFIGPRGLRDRIHDLLTLLANIIGN